MPLGTAFLFVAALLLIGLFLRARIELLQLFYVPASIIGGLIGLAAAQIGLEWIPEQTAAMADELRTWPGWLIAGCHATPFTR